MPINLAFAAAATEQPNRKSARSGSTGVLRICNAEHSGLPQKFPAAKAGASSAQSESVSQFSEQGLRLAAWMKAAQAGDRCAYENVIRASIPFIKMVARRQGVSADLVNDVVQETLLAVHRAHQSYDPVRPFGAWLRTIAQRRAIDVMRSQGRISTREVYEPISFENHSDPAENPEHQADQIDRKSLLGVAVASLPARQREAVEQLVIKGRSLVEAAVAIGLTPGALKVNFHRALKTLRAQMGAGKTISRHDSSNPRARGMTSAASVSVNLEHAFVKFAV
jgi:RNA polymerase sigma factor (sigma-70 family)